MYAPPDVAGDRAAAMTWARTLLALEPPAFVIFGCATTGMERFAEIVQCAVLASDGTTLLDTLVRPVGPIAAVATALHGITDPAVAGAPSFAEVYPQLAALLHGRAVLGWNSDRDQAVILQSHRALSGLAPPVPGTWHSLMLRYSAFIGEWDRAAGHYAHPDLAGTDHKARNEAHAARALLIALAAADTLALASAPAGEVSGRG